MGERDREREKKREKEREKEREIKREREEICFARYVSLNIPQHLIQEILTRYLET